jgi:hypothetical protein
MPRYAIPIALALLLAAGCDTAVQPPIPDPPDELAVYSTVEAWSSTQYAVVTKPRAADERQVRYVQDASVQIAGRRLSLVPEDSIGDLYLERPGEEYANYVTDSLKTMPGETYTLRVTRKEQEVTGTVQVPAAFQGTVDSMTVHWRPSAGAERYTLRVRRYNEDDAVEWEYITTTTDTMATIRPEEAEYSTSFQEGSHEVIITAADPNYVAYQKQDARRAGIEGGFGFFGAVTRIAGTISLPAVDTAKSHSGSPPLRPLRGRDQP